MENRIRFLAAFMLLQLLLAAIVLIDNEKYTPFEADEALLQFNRDDVNRIAIWSDDEQPLILQQIKQQWQLPQREGFPATQHSVTNLLNKLGGMKRGWPVAETRSAAARFQVAEDAFERKIILYNGEQELVRLYLGTSPGFRKIHARVADEAAIHAVTFNNFEASSKLSDWVDATILQLKPEEIEQIEQIKLPNLQLLREGESFTLKGVAATERPIPEKIDKLVKQIAQIDIQTTLGSTAESRFNLDKPLFEFSFTDKAGNQRSYSISTLENSSDYVLKSSSHDHYFKVASWAIDPIVKAERGKLIEIVEDE